MGCMLRSDPMTQCDMFLPPEAAFMVLSELGELGCAEFYDLNHELSAFQRTYVLEVCRCSDMERKLRYIGDKMREDDIHVPKLIGEPAALELHETNVYENNIEKWERLLVEMSSNLITMRKTYMEMTELSYVLTHIGTMLGNADLRLASGLVAIKQAASYSLGGRGWGHLTLTKKSTLKLDIMQKDSSIKKWFQETYNLFERAIQRYATSKGGKPSGSAAAAAAQESGSRFTVITGLVQRKRSYIFQLMLWRMARGNAFYKQTDEDQIFKDPVTNTDVRKVAFLLVVQGDELGVRMKKVCEGFRCDLYPLPPSPSERLNSLGQLIISTDDLSLVLKETRFQRCKVMRTIARSWPTYMMQVKKAKAIYHIMNEFSLDYTKKCLIGRCWIPTADLDQVQDILDKVSQKLESSVPCFMSKLQTLETPPTYHRTNRFTYGFQALISAYGDSSYRELNPGLYTIITFPFLFSLMFGDMGHGAIMFGAAVWMLVNEKKFMADRSDSEIWNIFFGGRYIILLMSCFSMYSGSIYNDCFGLSFTLFDSGWKCTTPMEELATRNAFLLEPRNATRPYYYGIDPGWQLAENKILFENSLKMKLSIIIGVIHMMFGLLLSFFNDIYFKRRYLIFLEFFPQILFLMCIFVWLVFLIFFKWFKYGGSNPPSVKESQGCAPLVLILFIDMALMSTSKPLAPECDAYMFGIQHTMQKALLFVAMCAIPIMLFGPPCFVAQSNKKERKALKKKVPDEEDEPELYAEWEHAMEHVAETFSDLMIHQAVHTIEFVLSTISHTASYLRLWALSLAHAQLSEMLWTMIFSKMALNDHSMAGGPKIVIVFAIWGFFTLAILVLMEGLSAFLHTLRLHWVEFMSKFFEGGGIMFKPFSFAILFSDTSKEKMEACPAPKTFEY